MGENAMVSTPRTGQVLKQKKNQAGKTEVQNNDLPERVRTNEV